MLAALVLLLFFCFLLLFELLLVVFWDCFVDLDLDDAENPVIYKVFEAIGLADFMFYEVFVLLLSLRICVEPPGLKTLKFTTLPCRRLREPL